jgi:hypothetical protein
MPAKVHSDQWSATDPDKKLVGEHSYLSDLLLPESQDGNTNQNHNANQALLHFS